MQLKPPTSWARTKHLHPKCESQFDLLRLSLKKPCYNSYPPGASRIFAVDPIAERRNVARQVGATETLAPEDVPKQIIQMTAGGVDCAIECVGSIATMQDAFHMIRDGGRAIVVGLPAFTEKLDIPAIMLLREKKLTGSIYGSSSPHIDFNKIATLGESGTLDFSVLVDKTRHFSEINEGFAEMRAGKLTRVVLTF